MEIIPTASAIVLIAALVSILGAFQVQRYIAFKNASRAFRSTVLDIFTGLYPEPSDWPSDGNAVDRKLQSVFPALQSAVADFKECLPSRKRREFDKAWSIYLRGSDDSDMGHYYQYMGYSSPDRVIPDSKTTFKGNVERLLFYAKET